MCTQVDCGVDAALQNPIPSQLAAEGKQDRNCPLSAGGMEQQQ